MWDSFELLQICRLNSCGNGWVNLFLVSGYALIRTQKDIEIMFLGKQTSLEVKVDINTYIYESWSCINITITYRLHIEL